MRRKEGSAKCRGVHWARGHTEVFIVKIIPQYTTFVSRQRQHTRSDLDHTVNVGEVGSLDCSNIKLVCGHLDVVTDDW